MVDMLQLLLQSEVPSYQLLAMERQRLMLW